MHQNVRTEQTHNNEVLRWKIHLMDRSKFWIIIFPDETKTPCFCQTFSDVHTFVSSTKYEKMQQNEELNGQ